MGERSFTGAVLPWDGALLVQLPVDSVSAWSKAWEVFVGNRLNMSVLVGADLRSCIRFCSNSHDRDLALLIGRRGILAF